MSDFALPRIWKSCPRFQTPATIAAIAIASTGLSGCSTVPPTPSAPAPTPMSSGTEAVLEGTYTLVVDGTQNLVNGVHRANGVPTTTTWQITPCGAGCSHVESSMGWKLDLHLLDGTWQGTREVTMDCSGTPTSSSVTYKLNAQTLTGRMVNTLRCEGQTPIVVDAPSVLTHN